MEWDINNNFILEAFNTYAFGNGITINNLRAELKYYPLSINSDFYTNINYSINYHELTDPTPDKELGLGIGFSF